MALLYAIWPGAHTWASAAALPSRGVSRRQATLGLAGGAAGLLLAACGAFRAAGPAAPGPATESGRVVHWSIAGFPFHEDIGAEFAREFRVNYPGIAYVPETVVGDRFQKLVTAAAADSAPDIGMAGSWQMQELGAAGIAQPLDDYLKASRMVKQADLWPTHVRDLTYRGKQYGMPFGPDVRVTYAHTEGLQGAGLSAAKAAHTWEELEEHVRRLSRNGAGRPTRLGFPPFWGSGGRNLWLIPFWQLGGETLSPDGVRVTIDNERGLAALEWLKRLHDLQGGWEAIEALRPQAPNSNAHFINGTMGYYFATFTERKSKEFVAVPDLRFGFAPWPLPKGGRRANYGGCHSYCITTQSKAPAAAWRFLEFLPDEQNNLRFAVRYDRIPIRVRTAQSTAYNQNDPFLKLAVEEMNVRRFVIPAPGGTEASGLTNTFIGEVMAGKRAVRDALRDVSTQIQLVLDKWKR